MNTEKFKSNLKLARVKVYSAINRGQFKFSRGVDNAKYYTIVSQETHKRTTERADFFTGEMLAYLKENPTGILKPLYPTREQFQMVELILDGINNGTIRFIRSGGKLLDDRPYIYKFSRAGNPLFENRDRSV